MHFNFSYTFSKAIICNKQFKAIVLSYNSFSNSLYLKKKSITNNNSNLIAN